MKRNIYLFVFLGFVFALSTATALARYFSSEVQSDTDFHNIARSATRCFGITHPQIGSRIVCPHPGSSAVVEAIRNFDLPQSCAQNDDSANARPGDEFVFSQIEGGCRFVRLGRVRGATRLLSGGKIDINNDSEAELALLPGIGGIKAAAIARSRVEEGPFRRPEDLDRVRGIGQKTIEKLRPWIEWTPAGRSAVQAAGD